MFYAEASNALTLAVVGWPADQHKAPVAIAAVDIALFVNLQPYLGMAERGGNVSAAITRNAGFTDADGFGLEFGHGRRLAKRRKPCNGFKNN